MKSVGSRPHSDRLSKIVDFSHMFGTFEKRGPGLENFANSVQEVAGT